MMDVLFNGVGWTDVALTVNRIAVGAFFMLSGYHKLFNSQHHRAFVDELEALGIHAVRFNQWWVPSVEFAAGGAVFIGLLAPLAALGLFVIILVALATSGRQRMKLYKPIDEADRLDYFLRSELGRWISRQSGGAAVILSSGKKGLTHMNRRRITVPRPGPPRPWRNPADKGLSACNYST